jgi:2,4-dienoyl-CoA reductase-like NADH-dependent reductase (Old Yellow Enzyme family)
MGKMFEDLEVGGIELKNRIAMAPLTRNRAEPSGTVENRTELMNK